jgi:GcrA cell cycle regulator
VSRNAVIGKAHRLGLPARPSPVKSNEAKAEAVPKAAPAPAPAPAAPPRPAPEPVKEVAAAEPEVDAGEEAAPAAEPRPDTPALRSVGPGGFVRQNPGEQAPPSAPAPPRRLVPAKPSEAIAGKTSLLDLNDRICKWPIGHPGEPDFHFCGDKVNSGFPYCVEHCGHAYQAQLPRRDRRPPPPLPFGGPRVR